MKNNIIPQDILNNISIIWELAWLEKNYKIKENAKPLIKKGKLSKKWRIRKKQIKKMPSLTSLLLAGALITKVVSMIKKNLERT